MTNEELVARIKTGIDVTDNMLALWEQTRSFIHMMAKRYQGEIDIEDLEQEGYLSLYDAIDGYDTDMGYKFLTYAEHRIKQRMVRYIQNNSAVRIPVHLREKMYQYNKIVNAYQMEHGRKPTRYEIAKEIGISYKSVISLEKAVKMANIQSIDRVIGEDESITLGDTVADGIDIESDVIEDVQKEQLKNALWPLVDMLPENQGEILRKRYKEHKTVREMGDNPEQIRKIETKAIRNLRKPKFREVLLPFFVSNASYSLGISGTSVCRFSQTWTSATERAAIYLSDGVILK